MKRGTLTNCCCNWLVRKKQKKPRRAMIGPLHNGGWDVKQPNAATLAPSFSGQCALMYVRNQPHGFLEPPEPPYSIPSAPRPTPSPNQVLWLKIFVQVPNSVSKLRCLYSGANHILDSPSSYRHFKRASEHSRDVVNGKRVPLQEHSCTFVEPNLSLLLPR